MPKSSAPSGQEGVFRHKLPNGAVLLVKEDPSVPVVSLNFWIEAGSIDERPSERGMAHLIEHMIFKGTKERGVGEISRQVEAAGGYLNAFTSFEHTCFYVVLPSGALHKALEVEFDAYLHSTFDAGELEKEKEVVFEEMRMRRDDPWSWSWEVLFGLLFVRNPYHWPVIGDKGILGKVPRESLLAYYKAHYVPSRTVITVVGNVKAALVAAWVGRHFARIRGKKAPPRRTLRDQDPVRLKVKLEEGDVQQVYLSLGFPTVPIQHPDTVALEILEAVLGDGASSRLNQSLREKDQTADEAGCDHFTGKFGGAFTFQALTDRKRLGDCLGGLMKEVRRIIEHGAEEEELAKIKDRVKASKVFEKQSVDGQAKSLGFWELQGGYQLEEEFLAALDSVTSADLARVAKTYLSPSRGSLVVYHPKGETFPVRPSYWSSLLEKGFRVEKVRPTPRSRTGLQRFRLKDGSHLLVKPRRGLPLISLGAFLPGGFREEGENKQGLTTLMAKSLLKGTAVRGHEEFSRAIEGLAAHLDSSMEKDYWGLTLDTLRKNFGRSLDLMVEALYRPAFSEKEVQKEKKLQAAAIERLKDDPSELAILHSDLLTFAGTPYAHRPMGNLTTVGAFTPSQVRSWHSGFLNRPGRTWVAVGDVDGRELKGLLDRKLPILPGRRRQQPAMASPLSGARSLQLENEGRQASLVLGFRAPRFGSPDHFPFRVLHTALNGMGGRLFVELREKRSLAYSVYGSHDSGTCAGIYQFYVGCAPGKVEEAKRGLLDVLAEVLQKGLTLTEIERAKTYMTGLYQVGLQSNRSQVHTYARYELCASGAGQVGDFPTQVKAVSPKSIQEAARRYFSTDRKTWVLLTPKGKREKD